MTNALSRSAGSKPNPSRNSTGSIHLWVHHENAQRGEGHSGSFMRMPKGGRVIRSRTKRSSLSSLLERLLAISSLQGDHLPTPAHLDGDQTARRGVLDCAGDMPFANPPFPKVSMCADKPPVLGASVRVHEIAAEVYISPCTDLRRGGSGVALPPVRTSHLRPRHGGGGWPRVRLVSLGFAAEGASGGRL
jgi:hypothetical protein